MSANPNLPDVRTGRQVCRHQCNRRCPDTARAREKSTDVRKELTQQEYQCLAVMDGRTVRMQHYEVQYTAMAHRTGNASR